MLTTDLKVCTEQLTVISNQDITISRNLVEFQTNRYIPFEPKYGSDEMKARAAIRTAVSGLKPADNEILVAEFGDFCDKKRFYDLENILFYNIGTSYFKQACRYGIAFSELPASFDHNANFVYRYKIMPKNTYTVSGKTVAEWETIPLEKISTSLKPFDYWKAFKKNRHKINVVKTGNLSGSFGIRLHIELPKGKQIHIASAMKPMLDGIICAFHPVKGDVSAFEKMLSCDKTWLAEEEKCVLSPREYVYTYRCGIKWNPEDDKCKSVLITVSDGDTQKPLISGSIFEL